MTGLRVVLWLFSEAQTGKDAADRVCAIIKRRIYDHIDKGNDVNSPADMFNAAKLGGLELVGISLYLCQNQEKFATNYKIPRLDIYSDFEFEDTSITAYRHYKIGNGKTFDANALGEKTMPFLVEFLSAVPVNEKFWLMSNSENEANTPIFNTNTIINDQIEESQEAFE